MIFKRFHTNFKFFFEPLCSPSCHGVNIIAYFHRRPTAKVASLCHIPPHSLLHKVRHELHRHRASNLHHVGGQRVEHKNGRALVFCTFNKEQLQSHTHTHTCSHTHMYADSLALRVVKINTSLKLQRRHKTCSANFDIVIIGIGIGKYIFEQSICPPPFPPYSSSPSPSADAELRSDCSRGWQIN